METLEGKFQNLVDCAKYQYNKLVLVVGQENTGKTTLLKAISESKNYSFINLNLELSRRMLGLTKRQRSLRLPDLLRDIIDSNSSNVILFDNIELLFDVELKQDPLLLLLGSSRNKIIVASWTGTMHSKKLTYASPEHEEYKSYGIHGFQMLNMNLFNE
ncbi:MAG: BREX-3 system P-loop-containing protein BrxF [Candidatus Sabulitectum sp.]|nr:BREX-3 system P-loop-containing protein BrxF [Candidatus Sabulitectum sp.]